MKAAMESVGTVTALGVTPTLARRLRRLLGTTLRWNVFVDDSPGSDALEEGVLRSDAVLLGAGLDDPVSWAQRVHRVDKAIPVLILAAPGEDAQLRRKILFGNHLGTEVRTFQLERLDELPQTLHRAVERRQQRRRYVGVIESAQVNLGKLSLFQPEVARYLDRLLDRAPLGVVSVDARCTVLSLSRRAEAIFGAVESTLLGQPLEMLFAAPEHARLRSLLRAVAKGVVPALPCVLRVGAEGPRPVWVEVTVAPLAYHASQHGAMLMLQDVSERVAAELERERAVEDLRSHVSMLSTFHRISSAGHLSFRKKLHQLLEFGCRQLETPYGLLLRLVDHQLEVVDSVTPTSMPAVGELLRLDGSYCAQACEALEPLCIDKARDARLPPVHIGGERIDAYLGMRVVVHGEVYGAICFASPVLRDRAFSSTDRETLKLIAQWVGGALQRDGDEAQMRMLSGALEQAADSVILTDAQGRIEYVNPAFERASGYTKHEVTGRGAYTPHGSSATDAALETLWRTVRGGEAFRGVVPSHRQDGSSALEEITVTPLRDLGGHITHFIATGHDVTERTRAEEAARHHQTEMAHVARLSTLGEMTSGLAHELTQPLCAITTYAQTCMRILHSGRSTPDQLQYGLEQVVKQADLGGAIFRRLRNFARKEEPPVRRRVALAELIREAVSLIRADLEQKQIELRCLGRGAPVVHVDSIQIEQVFVNLLRNSIDAIGALPAERRRLTIRHKRSAAGAVCVMISDRGPGCPPDLVPRLFQPFFTTKPMGLGIGLGISQTIIEAHGGTLMLQSNSPQGATFAFTLPAIEKSP